MEKGSELDGTGEEEFPISLPGWREKERERGREETETNSIPSEWKGGTEGKLSVASHVEKKHLGFVVGGHQKPPLSNVVVLQVWSWASSSSVP